MVFPLPRNLGFRATLSTGPQNDWTWRKRSSNAAHQIRRNGANSLVWCRTEIKVYWRIQNRNWGTYIWSYSFSGDVQGGTFKVQSSYKTCGYCFGVGNGNSQKEYAGAPATKTRFLRRCTRLQRRVHVVIGNAESVITCSKLCWVIVTSTDTCSSIFAFHRYGFVGELCRECRSFGGE